MLDGKGRLLAAPKVTVHGLLEDDAAAAAELGDRIGDAVEELRPGERRDDEAVREAARLAVRRSLKASTGKRPVIDIHVVRV